MLKYIRYLLIYLPTIANSQPSAIPLWKSNYDSAQFYWASNIEKSLPFLQRAEHMASNDLGIYDENYLIILGDLGLAYRRTADFAMAAKCLRQNFAIHQEIYPMTDNRVAQSQCNLAALFLESGNDEKGKKLYQDVLEKSLRNQDERMYTVACKELLRWYETHEMFDSALVLVRNSLLTQFADKTIQSAYLSKLDEGRLLRKQKKFEEATLVLVTLDKSISLPSQSLTLINSVKVELCLIDIEMGLYGKAEQGLLLVYRATKKSLDANETLLTELTSGLAYVYEKLEVYDKALAYYQESLSRCVTTYGHSSLGCLIIKSNMAGIYLKQGLVKEAISEYERFEQEFQKFPAQRSSSNYLIALNNLATAYRQNGQYELALQRFMGIYLVLEKRGQMQNDLAATVINNMAVTYTLKGEYQQAITYFEEVLTIKEKLYGKDSPVLLDVIDNLAIAYWAVHRFADAYPLLQRSLKLSVREVKYIFPGLTETEQVQFYQRHKKSFERFNTFSIQYAHRQPELLVSMVNNQLFLKSLTFFTNKKRASSLRAKSDTHLTSLVTLAQSKRVALGHFYQIPLSELHSLHLSLLAKENEIDSLEKIIRVAMHRQENNDRNVEWRDIQQSLQEDEALIDIIRFRKYDLLASKNDLTSQRVNIGFTDSIYYAALITTQERDFPLLVLLKNGNSLEKRYASYYKNALKFDVSDTISYSKFWLPFERLIVGKQKIYISADGIYHQINLNAIHDNDGKYILEKYDLHPLLNGAQLVSRTERKDIDFSKSVLMGEPIFDPLHFEPLPGTRDEINGIANLLRLTNAHATMLLRQAANETNLREVNSPSVLHIATHGFFSEDFVYLNEQAKDNFLFHSGIILSSNSMEAKEGGVAFDHDGIVTAYEVLNLELHNTDLVVLSACDTGLGKIENGEGVYGLQRSFLQAGARDVILSLWKVEDLMTKDLMVKFYGYLAQRISTHEAFKRAQLDRLREIRNPRHWAAFVLVSGD